MSWTVKDLLDTQFWRGALAHRGRLVGIRVLGREERRNALAFGQILVNSFFSRESVLRAFGIDSKVCYLGIDMDKFFNQNKKRESFVVSVGALIPTKNVEFLIESVGRVAPPLRPQLLLVANTIDHRYLERIRKLAVRAQVNLELMHRIDDSELVDILNRARIMLYAPRLEPFGYAPLEANACGLPVIAVAEGGVRETIQDGVNGILVEHDPQAMAAAIERLLVEDGLHKRLSEGALQLVRDMWSWGPSIDRLESRLMAGLGNARCGRYSGNASEDSAFAGI
jgi:glycosyltransferase involved in cell wall biosynthesis